eukprot:TRINITY_DN5316_c0_g1_i4.p1 TRINITY_DN5316_c0_g1~~TRINITY_DN5316_c0_g1_i4.p1  ORF type:complete len:337 (-),score=84.37 TRINITY_DN5316_c0_g1_i4:100-1110(-)
MAEENLLFDHIEAISAFLHTDEQCAIYMNFLLSFLQFKPNDPHNSVFIRRVLIIIKRLVSSYVFPLDVLKNSLEKLYTSVMLLVELRYANIICEPILCCTKNVVPLWYEAGITIISISSFLISADGYRPQSLRQLCRCSIKSFKSSSLDDADPKNVEMHGNHIVNKEAARKMLKDKEFEKLAWSIILESFREILLIKEEKLALLDKTLAEEVTTKLQDLGITLIDFILKGLLKSPRLPPERHKDLVSLIDAGSGILEKTLNRGLGYVGVGESDEISRHCLEMVIEMYEVYNEKAEFAGVLEKVAKFTTPVLIHRCKGMIKKYLTEEKSSGLIPLPK